MMLMMPAAGGVVWHASLLLRGSHLKILTKARNSSRSFTGTPMMLMMPGAGAGSGGRGDGSGK